MNRNSLILVAVGLLIGVLLGWLLLGNRAANLSEEPRAGGGENPLPNQFAPRVGAQAPDFELQSIEGQVVKLSDLRGKPVLINFWATWCGPCRIEMPAIQSEFEAHYPDLEVLAVNFDEPPDEVKSFADELGLTFEVLLDEGGQVNGDLYRVRGYPSSFFVDPDGVIQVVQIGILTEGQLQDYLSRVGLE